MRRCRTFAGVVIAHQRNDATMFRRTRMIGMAQRIAGPVDARPLAVPEPADAVILAFAAQLGLLCTPDGGGREFFVDGWLADNAGRRNLLGSARKLPLQPRDGRTAIAGDIARRVQPCEPVTLMLHEHQPHRRLRAGEQHTLRREVEFVGERSGLGHGGLRWVIAIVSYTLSARGSTHFP